MPDPGLKLDRLQHSAASAKLTGEGTVVEALWRLPSLNSSQVHQPWAAALRAGELYDDAHHASTVAGHQASLFRVISGGNLIPTP